MTGDAFITGWGVCLPNAPVDNAHIEAVLGHIEAQSAAVKRRVLINNGIQTRHYAIDPATGAVTHSNAGMTAEAIRAVCASTGLSPADIACLACGSSSADQVIPSHASMVHAALGTPPCETMSPTGVCCAGISALKYATLVVAAGQHPNAVATGSELASPSLRASHFEPQIRLNTSDVDEHPMLPFSNEFLRWMLSDGAGALMVEPAPRPDRLSLKIDWIDLVSYASDSDVCMYFGLRKDDDGAVSSWRTVDDEDLLYRGGYLSLSQDVRVLNDRLPALMKRAFARMQERRGVAADRIDWLLPHFSSNWFRQPLHDGLVEAGFPIPAERWFTNLATRGNTGSAAFYIMLEELMASGRVSRGDRILGIVPESSRMLFGFLHLTAV
ncbi:MAG: beta-ketoacyl-ACP synthase III [Bauldia sp.]|nr:beta-ketoacyl-ACP synthase III [Bauldia sp.]